MDLFEFDDEDEEAVNKYAVQIAQSRIVGLKRVLDYLLDGGLFGWLDRGKEDEAKTKSDYKGKIDEVYNISKKCGLKLSDKLPYYNEYGK